MISLCLTTVPASNSSSENATHQETTDEMSPITSETSVSETNVSAKMEGTTAKMPQENLTISHSTSGNLHNSQISLHVDGFFHNFRLIRGIQQNKIYN